MISNITLNNAKGEAVVLHEVGATVKRSAEIATGLIGIGPVRESKRIRPQAHGSINETKYEEGRPIVINGEVFGATVEEAFTEYRAITQACLETLDSGPALLKWTEGTSGNKLQMMVKLDAELDPPIEGGWAVLKYQLHLLAEDPRAYAQTATEASGATITGTGVENEFSKAVFGEWGLAIDGSHIYWGNKKAIGRAALTGGTIEPEWIKLTNKPGDIKVSSEYIYWFSTVGIGRCKLSEPGSPNNEFIPKAEFTAFGSLYSIAIDGTYIYCGNTSSGGPSFIGRAKLAGTSIEPSWLNIGSYTPYSVAVNSEYVYWGTASTIGRATIAGAEANSTFMATGGAPSGIYLDATYIYWTVNAANALGRAKLAGTEIKSAFYAGLLGPVRLAGNASHLYWNNQNNGYIGRSENLSGGPVGGALTIAQSGNRPTPLTIKIEGPILNPSVVRESDGSRIALVGEITTGNYAEINCAERTVKLNGTSNLLSFLSAPGTNWEAFAPLASTVYYLAATSATAAKMKISYRSSFA